MKLLKHINRRLALPVNLSAFLLLVFSSCQNFLEENPRGFLTTSQFYQTPNQIKAAVDGAYRGLETPFTSTFLGLPFSEFYTVESLTGFCTNDAGTGADEKAFETLSGMNSQNGYLPVAFNGLYIPMENINAAISNIAETTIIEAEVRDQYLAQLYFLRGYHYFKGVQLFGEIPLKTTPTAGISMEDVQIPKATIARLYEQIVSDLTTAETLGLPWSDPSGHASLGAVKTLLVKVYMAMAGFPLQKGKEYYQLAYDKAAEVIESEQFELFPDYEDLRSPDNGNRGEHIFMVQRQKTIDNSELHYAMLPAPGKTDPPISINNFFNPALRPTMAFYNSYDKDDRRKADRAFFFEYTDGEVMNYKYWDGAAAVAAPSGANIQRLRYADVLLLCAEAKAQVDGGRTNDPLALDAYGNVRGRAFPGDRAPTAITVDQVLQERYLELAFEYQIWFDMLRTRRTWDTESKEIVDLIGHKATTHLRPFEEGDLILPLPLVEEQRNPRLTEPAE